VKIWLKNSNFKPFATPSLLQFLDAVGAFVIQRILATTGRNRMDVRDALLETYASHNPWVVGRSPPTPPKWAQPRLVDHAYENVVWA